MKSVTETEFQAAIVFDDVRFSYEKDQEKGGKNVIDHFSMTIPEGSRCVLFGPSGAGKSTLLKLISHLQQPESGTVINRCSRISMVFQKDRLFDHLSAIDNIRYGLKKGTVPEKERTQKAQYWAERFQCADLLYRKTGTLSGGQRQRIALARAFMKDPDLLLMDESFQGFDSVLREQLISAILRLQAKKQFTLILITHSFGEAIKMGDYLVLIQDGRKQAEGELWRLAQDPQNLFAAGSLGYFPMNLLPASQLQFLTELLPEKTVWIGFYPWQARIRHQRGYSGQNADPAELETAGSSPSGLFVSAQCTGAIPLGVQDVLIFAFNGFRAQVVSEHIPDDGLWRRLDGFSVFQICCFDGQGNRIAEIRIDQTG